jgi:hypothetical protein
MDATYRTSRRQTDLLGVVIAVTGLLGSLCSLVLWLYQMRSASPLLGSWGWEIAHGGPLRIDLIQLALVLGIVAVVGALLSAAGSRRVPASFPIGLLLGALALSYPVLAMLGVVEVPVRAVLFR